VTLRVWHFALAVVLAAGAAAAHLALRADAPAAEPAQPSVEPSPQPVEEVKREPSEEAAPAKTRAFRTARAALRNAIPSIEAYYIDHDGSYEGMTTEELRTVYDSLLPLSLRIPAPSLSRERYCIQIVVDGVVAHLEGPLSREAKPGPCP
jgi:hypothetical protein